MASKKLAKHPHTAQGLRLRETLAANVSSAAERKYGYSSELMLLKAIKVLKNSLRGITKRVYTINRGIAYITK
jgi:hypothetical protein